MLTIGSLFSGIGGLELGLEWAGFGPVKWQVETDNHATKILEKHWPDTKRFRDIRDCGKHNLEPVGLICGGDPCPIRSRAKGNRKAKSSDLSGYFLAVVGSCRPEWVVRENVLASDDVFFKTTLEVLGYRTVIVRANSALYTGQNKQRDFIIGSLKKTWPSGFEQLYLRTCRKRSIETSEDTANTYPCLTTQRCRYDARDGYIWDGRGALRLADSEERTALAGFPGRWLEGLSDTRVAILTGNAVVPQVSQAIGKILIEWLTGGVR